MDVPLSLDDIKIVARTSRSGIGSMGPHYRNFLWPVLPTYSGKEDATINMRTLPDSVETAQALLKQEKRASPTSKTDLLAMLNFKNKTVDPILYVAVCDILSNVLPNLDVCFLTCYNMVNNSNEHINYIPSTMQGNIERMLVFKELLKRYMPTTFVALEAMNALDFQYLDLMFKDFFIKILPESALNEIMDSFLVEGEKVIFRYAVALIKMYKRQIKSGTIKDAKQFWSIVQADFKQSAGPEVDAKVAQLREFAFEIQRFVLFKAARPMMIGKADLDAFKAHVRQEVYPRLESSGSFAEYKSNWSSPINRDQKGI